MKEYNSLKKILAVITAAVLLSSSFVSCKRQLQRNPEKESNDAHEAGKISNEASDNITIPETDDEEEEIKVNTDYASSELYDFTGTIEELYEDGSMLIYSPEFRVDFNYHVIVEFDENSVIDSFTPAVNQHIKFEVYSVPKKTNPLTVVASKLTLLNEVSTQREEEAARIAKVEANAAALEKK